MTTNTRIVMHRAAAAASIAALLAALGCGDAQGGGAAASVTPVASHERGPAPAPPVDRDRTGLEDVATPAIGAAGMSVLLVSVDTTRADHIGCYGQDIVKTPNIDRMAAEGTRFADCISSAPLTLPSHSTMLTGSYPFVHGARDNGIFTLAEDNVTLPEIFKAAGYATHAEVAAAVLGTKYGLAQGFDTYGHVIPLAEPIVTKPPAQPLPADASKPEIEMEVHKVEADRKAWDITDHGIEALTEVAAADRPFFMFLHYFDPHWPHEAPEPFKSEYKDGYHAEIAYFDQEFGRLLDAVGTLGLDDRTLVILTSDHGEGRGEHGEYTHSTFLYDSTLHVPLIMRCPSQIPAGRVVETQVRLVDLAPTILAFARLSPTPQMQGVSLLPLVDAPDLEARLPCYSDTMVPHNSLNYSALRALRVDGWKYVLAPRPELYDIGKDPLEVFNIITVEPGRAAVMREELREIIADSPPAPGGRGHWQSLAEEDARNMAALGYISGQSFNDSDMMSGSELDHFEPSGTNPRDRVEVIECWAAGLGAYRAGDYETALRSYERFVELEPTNAVGLSYLGRVLMMLERNDEAITWLRKAVELQPEGFIDQRVLGNLLAKQGDFDEAIRCYRTAIDYNPNDAIARLNLGMILASRGETDEAIALFDKALSFYPDYAPLHFQRGSLLARLDRTEEAVADLEAAVRVNPSHLRARGQLARAYHRLGRTDEAIAYLKTSIDQLPDAAMLHSELGDLYAALGDFDAAGAKYAEVVELLPDNALARANLGANLLARGRMSEAVEQYRLAVGLAEDNVVPRLHLAGALEAAGELEEAEATYLAVATGAPQVVEAYTRAAGLMAGRGDRSGAIALLRLGHERMPDDVLLANDLAWNLAVASDPDLRDVVEAVKLAEFANAQRGGESANELDTLAAAYAAAGRFEEAVAAAGRALDLARGGRQDVIAASIAERLALYEQGTPYQAE